MDWPRLGAVLHTTGLWGRSYPRCKEAVLPAEPDRELCQREDTGLPWGKPYRGMNTHMRLPRGNQAIRTPSPVQGLTGDLVELTQYWAWRQTAPPSLTAGGAWRNSTRVHRPGNWTGGEKGARIPGWGGMAQQAWHRPVLPAHYLPNTWEETGSTRRL